MRSKSGSFVYDDAFKKAEPWGGGWHHIGDRARFAGMLLRCGVDHFAGDMAQHPWDPGWGWGDGAARLWEVLTPAGMAMEADVARIEAERLRDPVTS